MQYAEQAVRDDPTNAGLHGNLGVMYSKNNEIDDAIDHLGLAIQGGVTDDGDIVEGLPLSYELRTIEIYSTYGLTLAREDQCGEAIPIFQTMLSVVPDNEIAVYNAETGLEICQEGLKEAGDEAEGSP